MALALVLALLAAGATGCGGSSSTKKQSQSAATSNTAVSSARLSGGTGADRRAVLSAVSSYYLALQAHHGEQACAHLSPAAQRRIVAEIVSRTSHFGHTCTQILGGVGLLLSGQVHVVNGTVGSSTATLAIRGKSPGSLTLIKASGRWLISRTS